MGDKSAIQESRARLAALSAAKIDWPAGAGVDTEGDPARGWDGPYLAGTWLHVADAGRNLAEDWEECRPWYRDRADAECRAMRDYYVAHRDLFRASAWRAALTSTATAPGEDGARLLRADVAALLAEVDRLRAALSGLLGGMDDLCHYQHGTTWRGGNHTEAMYQEAVAALLNGIGLRTLAGNAPAGEGKERP